MCLDFLAAKAQVIRQHMIYALRTNGVTVSTQHHALIKPYCYYSLDFWVRL